MSELACAPFEDAMMDELYDELDDDARALALTQHVASCEACARKQAQLRATRQTLAPIVESLVEEPPPGLEAKVLAAIEAAVAATPNEPAPEGARGRDEPAARAREDGASRGEATDRDQVDAPPRNIPKRGRVIALFSRPSFALAATVLLFLGGAALLARGTASRSEMAAAPAEASKAAAEEAVALGTAASAAAEPVALAETDTRGGSTPAPALMAEPAAAAGGATDASKSAKAKADPSFKEAKALYDAGRYAEALPRFEALAATNPTAELYAARCLARTGACAEAAPRFDAVAQRTAGEEASRATLEGARCYQTIGQRDEARSRLHALAGDEHVAREAKSALGAMDGYGGVPGTPAAARPAARAVAKPAAPAAAPAATANTSSE